MTGRYMFCCDRSLDAEELTDKIVALLQERDRRTIEEVCELLQLKMVNVPVGVNPPFYYHYCADGKTLIILINRGEQ